METAAIQILYAIDLEHGTVSPSDPQYAGVQGDNQAAYLAFTVPETYRTDSYVYRIAFLNGTGAYYTTDLLPLGSDNTVGTWLSVPVTNGGAQVIARLIISAIVDGSEPQTVKSADGRIWFREAETEQSVPFEQAISLMLSKTEEAASEAQASAEEAAQSKQDAEDAKDAAQDASSSAQTSAEQAAESAQAAAGAAATKIEEHDADPDAHEDLFDGKLNYTYVSGVDADTLYANAGVYRGHFTNTPESFGTLYVDWQSTGGMLDGHVTQVFLSSDGGSGRVWTRAFEGGVSSGALAFSDWVALTNANELGDLSTLSTTADTVVGAINELEEGKLPYQVLTTDTDVDDLTETGYYTGMISGLPTAANGVLVSNFGNEVVQTVFSTSENGRLFQRKLSNGAWSTLRKILDTSDVINSFETALADKPASSGQTWYLNQSLGDVSDLTTEATTVVGAINELNEVHLTRYGVKFGGAANSGESVTRLYDAVGLAAGVGTDTSDADNDFDSIYPWSARRRCCGNFDAAGRFRVGAYAGESGYTTDGSNGEVWVEHSLFYYKHENNTDGSEEVSISPYPIPGYAPAPLFVNADGTLRQKAYTAAYPMATVDGKATSRSGVFPDACSLNSAMTAARTLGEQYTVTTIAERYTEWLYMVVEFATRDFQTVMCGATGLPYLETDTAVVAETGANRIIVANAVADKFVVGQTIGIGTTLGADDVAVNRLVTAITDYDADNRAMAFDGAAVDIAVGNIVYTLAYQNGSCDGVLASSGSPVSNSSGKYTCVYRGNESPFGNAFEWVSDLLFQRTGEGTAESPYAYDVYYLPDPTAYSSGSLTDDYVKLRYQLPTADGYVKTLGLDSRYPHVRLPKETGGSSTTYYADFYYRPVYAVTAANAGGHWHSGAEAGMCCWYCFLSPTLQNNKRRARLSYCPG